MTRKSCNKFNNWDRRANRCCFRNGFTKTGEDLGQTLGYHGINAGPYLVLPLLGSNSTRDLPGTIVSMIINPLAWLDDISLRNQLVE
ncbi:MAG: hypothetical protein CM15mP93_13710 [Thiotrichaceae bacterium]|nr:MAG: hypothetical protein CM15mP93_13710 [Thiotrichaceae bacterium]